MNAPHEQSVPGVHCQMPIRAKELEGDPEAYLVSSARKPRPCRGTEGKISRDVIFVSGLGMLFARDLHFTGGRPDASRE